MSAKNQKIDAEGVDAVYETYKDFDFSNAKRADEIPHLAKLRAENAKNKSRITMWVDSSTLAVFKARAAQTGGNYQTLMNEALRQYAEGQTLALTVRQAVKEALTEAVKG